ncbi:MAG: hypothetical protein QXE01_05320 [Sulfolobales archaeon]
MQPLKIPPRIKVLEALGAIADGRIKITSDKEAIVISSEGDRSYRVYVDLDRRIADSSDNGTTYRGYIGYPIIAFLMLRGAIPFRSDIAEALKGVRWKYLNEKYKSYSAVESIIYRDLKAKSIDINEVNKYVEDVIKALSSLGLRRPAKTQG